MPPKYKKIRHTERPFCLHVFIGYDPLYVCKKINGLKSAGRIEGVYFEKNHFDMADNDEGCVFELDDALPGHFCLILKSPPTASTITHELFHITARHFRYIGTPLTLETEESYAYMMSWLTEHIYKML